MPTINDLPADVPWGTGFGEGFNYAAWTADTTIELCNVPWNNDYRDIVEFASSAALDTYLAGVSGPKFTLTHLTLARAGEPVRVNLPFNQCYQFNYLRVTNGAQPIPTYSNGVLTATVDTVKPLYYFITDVRYIAPNTTELMIQLDVWQTFGRDITFGNCYVERGHIGVANENNFDNNGRDYLTVAEGLDVGSEYVIAGTDIQELAPITNAPASEFLNVRETTPWVVVGIGANVGVDPGDVNAPNLAMSSGAAHTDGMPNGFDILIFTDRDEYYQFISAFADKPWILQSIQFITMIPPYRISQTRWDLLTSEVDFFDHPEIHAFRLQNFTAEVADYSTLSDWRDDVAALFGSRYSGFKKFLTYPYCVVEMTAYNGTPLILKPELMNGDNVDFEIYQQIAPPNPTWAIVPKNYNARTVPPLTDPWQSGEYLDFAIFLRNFPQFTILNNSYLNYLASNKNGIAYAYSSNEWSQQKALAGASTASEQASMAAQAQQQQAQIQTGANAQSAQIGNNAQTAHAALNFLTSGSHMADAAIQGVGGTVTDVISRNLAMQNANNAIMSSSQVNQGVTRFNRDTNYEYAAMAAKGDYQNTINGIQARVNDAKMLQPTSIGQVGGEAFIPAAIGSYNVFTKIKVLPTALIRIIGEYWIRYGYAVNLFMQMPDSLHCMNKFTYWKLKEAYITSSRCPEQYRQAIRGIFEKGVTVWVSPGDIGTIDVGTNTPLSGISF